jgi:hypothetical protein
MSAPPNSIPPPPPPPAPSVAPGKTVHLQPAFFRAWSGIWLFTWKSLLTWRRLRWTSVLLLVLPFLVWKTVDSPQSWSATRNSLPLGNSTNQLQRTAWQISRQGARLSAEQTAQLQGIFSEEYEHTQRDYRAIPSPETSVDQQRALVQSCHQRIRERAKSVLDDRQFAQFQAVDKGFVTDAQDRIGEPAWGRTAPFYRWLIDFYFFIILPLSCVRSCGGLIRDELQTDTLGFLTTRPVKRGTLVVLKYLSQAAWLEMAALLEGLLLLGAGALREIPQIASLLPLFLAAQFLAVLAWSALGLFLGQVTKRYLPLALVYGLIVELGIGDIPTNINTLSLMRHLKTLLSHDQALQSLYQWTGTGFLLPVTALLLAAVLFLALAALLFTFREYHAAAEMQK